MKDNDTPCSSIEIKGRKRLIINNRPVTGIHLQHFKLSFNLFLSIIEIPPLSYRSLTGDKQSVKELPRQRK